MFIIFFNITFKLSISEDIVNQICIETRTLWYCNLICIYCRKSCKNIINNKNCFNEKSEVQVNNILNNSNEGYVVNYSCQNLVFFLNLKIYKKKNK